jgi:hypothetical protein
MHAVKYNEVLQLDTFVSAVVSDLFERGHFKCADIARYVHEKWFTEQVCAEAMAMANGDYDDPTRFYRTAVKINKIWELRLTPSEVRQFAVSLYSAMHGFKKAHTYCFAERELNDGYYMLSRTQRDKLITFFEDTTFLNYRKHNTIEWLDIDRTIYTAQDTVLFCMRNGRLSDKLPAEKIKELEALIEREGDEV